jgi:proline dehydrogenase
VLNHLLFSLAKRFVSGQNIQQAVAAVHRLNQQGIMATLDFLGENVSEPGAAEAAAGKYLETLDWIHRTHIQSGVSIKLTQMGLDISRELCFANLLRICQKAASCQNFVRIDMEGSAYTERTLSLFRDLHDKYKNVGVVIQAYLHRSAADVERLIDVGACVRLCKGAYKEPPSVAIQQMPEIRKNFMKLAAELLKRGNYPAIATHDDVLISWVKRFVQSEGLDRKRFEFQMLYGVRPETQRQLTAEGYPMRVYVPFGTHWLPYFYRRLRERRENVYFVLKNVLKS